MDLKRSAVRTAQQSARRAVTRALLVVIAAASGLCGGARAADDRIAFDLTRAIVVTPGTISPRERKAVELLVEDVARRSGVRWTVADGRTALDRRAQVVAVGRLSAAASFPPFAGLRDEAARPAPDAYRILARPSTSAVLIAGNDERGVLFGVGRLLREIRTGPGRVWLDRPLNIITGPAFPLRGHQLGYRPKTNSYDAWDLPRWERYIRDLAIFGTNAVELLPPRTDDSDESPHFPRPQMEMMVGMSRLLDEYGLDVWAWYPALEKDYNDGPTVARELEQWGEVFRRLPRLDAVYVPGGDPGHTPPAILIPFLGRVAEVLHRYHPKATLWVSPQGFPQPWLDEFLGILRTQPLPWLAGVVHGPQIRISAAELRRALPERYALRTYPDITHLQQCQFPVPDWDVAFSMTESRETINPRPMGEAAIFNYYQPGTIGFLTYSEGCNDDVNKFVWSGLGWDPHADVEDILRQYARAFLADPLADRFAKGLLALERNWQGPLRTNEGVERTLSLFQALEKEATPDVLGNWRFQQAVYRAYYDAYIRRRLLAETKIQDEALAALGTARAKGVDAAIAEAERGLARLYEVGPLDAIRARVRSLGDDLFASVRMQLSEPLHDAIAVDRGANLDTLDMPLTDRLWLRDRLAEARRIRDEPGRLAAVEAILHRTDPGPGGFYDDLGNLEKQPHLVRGLDYAADPDFRRSPYVGFGSRAGWPIAWCQNAQTLHDAPLSMRYEGLDASARYRVRITYAGDSFRNKIHLDAEGTPVHDWFQKPDPPMPVEFDVPASATADGRLELTWRQEPGKGRNGRGCQVAEVWLLRK
ncbi:hypothetical protein OJF2_49310 [Aquisphaera giovannonii]|uniref:Alpha glucuronidase N-terminal domain-containing protein n=1 Tax=Aquisphaera giovannonii TaxID=406548 RepID=A0A5B9W897_9BACT|nr:hypothetical protein [Aquisphaera giovannonii]QEH36369.1 hypothetical protein OJF2_49310 [Aquisphaera giovannonii]